MGTFLFQEKKKSPWSVGTTGKKLALRFGVALGQGRGPRQHIPLSQPDLGVSSAFRGFLRADLGVLHLHYDNSATLGCLLPSWPGFF